MVLTSTRVILNVYPQKYQTRYRFVISSSRFHRVFFHLPSAIIAYVLNKISKLLRIISRYSHCSETNHSINSSPSVDSFYPSSLIASTKNGNSNGTSKKLQSRKIYLFISLKEKNFYFISFSYANIVNKLTTLILSL